MSVNRIIFITGASRGIGNAILHRLAAVDSYVIGTATTASGAAAITQQLESVGHAGEGVVLDVTDSKAVTTVLTEIQQRVGHPTVLVNNAGITRDNLLLRMTDEEWNDTLATNLTAVFQLSKAVLKGMMKARFGRIISIGSVVGSSGNAGQANYAAAKAGLIGFSKSLAQEIGSRGITVNVVSPGFIETDMTADLPAATKDTLLAGIPLKRPGTPNDIADAVCFLASESASYITGETLHVNGGMNMY